MKAKRPVIVDPVDVVTQEWHPNPIMGVVSRSEFKTLARKYPKLVANPPPFRRVCSSLSGTVQLLGDLRGDRILVPTPTEASRKRFEKAIQELAPHERRLVEPVDQLGLTWRAVKEFMAPLESTEEIRRLGEIALYRIAIGCKHKATVFDSGLPALHNALAAHPHELRGEAATAMRGLRNFGRAYRPFLSDRFQIIQEHDEDGIRGFLLEELLTSEPYERILDEQGHLGLVRRPTLDLRKIGQMTRSVLRDRRMRAAWQVGKSSVEVWTGTAPSALADLPEMIFGNDAEPVTKEFAAPTCEVDHLLLQSIVRRSSRGRIDQRNRSNSIAIQQNSMEGGLGKVEQIQTLRTSLSAEYDAMLNAALAARKPILRS